MPLRNPDVVQLDFPQLTSDLINELRLTGTIGLLNFLPEVRPTFIIGSRGLSFLQEETVYLASEIFQLELNNPASALPMADTGPLPAGDYDVKAWMDTAQSAGSPTSVQLDHRNAADTATLSSWFGHTVPNTTLSQHFAFSIRLAEDERLRFSSFVAFTGRTGSTIMIKRRVVP